MKTLKNLLASLRATNEALFANEEKGAGGKTFDFRKMVMGLLGAKEDATDAELEEMANACMKDETDYGKLAANVDEEKKKAADALAGETAAKAEATAANEKLTKLEASAVTAKSDLDAALARATKAETDFANETAKFAKLTTEKEAVATKLSAAELQVANERKAFATSYVNLGIESGRISGAEKATWEKDFANSADYTATAAKLCKLPSKWKTTTGVNGLGNRSSESLSRSEKVLNRVAELQAANEKAGLDGSYEFCFAQVKKEMAAEFDQMTQPDSSRNNGKKN